MKKKRGVYLVGGLLLLCGLCAVYFFMKKNNQQEEVDYTEEVEEEDSSQILSWNAEEVQKITFDGAEEQLTFAKNEEEWILEQDEDFPVDQSSVADLFSSVGSLQSERTLENVKSLSDYGLENPAQVVQVEMTDGNIESISIGSKNISTGHTYIYLNDQTDVVYTVSTDLSSIFSSDLYDFAEGEEMPDLSAATVQNISVEKEKDSYQLMSDAEVSSGWYVKEDGGKKKEADAEKSDSLKSTVTSLGFETYYEYDCKDWEKYGLDDPKMTLKVDYTEEIEVEDETAETENESESESEESDEETEEVETEIIEGSYTLYVGDLSEDGYYYVRLDDSSEVHGISQETMNTLKTGKAFDYLNRTVSSISIQNLDYLEVIYDGESHILKRQVEENTDEETEETEYETTYYIDEKEADATLFMNFYRLATAMECQERLEKYDETEDAEITLKFYGTDESSCIITYTVRDANFYTAADQDDNYGLINKMDVKDLISSYIELINSIESK